MSLEKIRAEHLSRSAYVYLRQSTMAQVVTHSESTARQYGLTNRAIDLGWRKEAVVVIDEDLGRSGQSADARTGFLRLAEDVAHGRVGAIFAIEVSRLARSSADWHRLLELCTVADVVIADEHAVYRPHADYNDRMLLGFKGQMSEAESYWMRLRLYGAKISKARRGQLRFKLPPGLVWSGEQITLNPDESVRRVLALIFERFRIDASAKAVVRYLRAQDVLVPHDGSDGLRWLRADYKFVHLVLKDPLYAGAYAYGRRQNRVTLVDGQIRRKQHSMLPIEKWPILIRDSHPGYITWDEYMANQKILESNRASRALPERRGAPRNGEGLLQGLVLCGCCGRRMRTRYIGRTNVTYYWCDQEGSHAAGGVCWTVAAKALDEAVEALLLDTVQPAELDLSLAVLRQAEAQSAEIDKQWQMRLERLQYEVRKAERRYRAVDPEYRLVARTLEREWEDKLREVADAEREHAEAKRRTRTMLSDRDRAAVLALAKDLRRVWRASTTSNADRKTLLRMLVQDVIVRPVDVPVRKTSIQVVWQTAATTQIEVPRPGRGTHIKTSANAMRIIRELTTAGRRASEIANELNRRGLAAGTGGAFTTTAVKQLQKSHRVRAHSAELPEQRADGRYSVRGAAARLGVSDRIIYYWAAIGRLEGERDAKRAWWFALDDATIARLGRRTTG